MARILAIGNATLDIINIVDQYPLEDEEVRARAQHFRRGGNACNTLAVLSQLGHQCSWAGTLADEPDAAIIREDLEILAIDISAVKLLKKGKVPTSYISISSATGSRTIVHYRDLPEFRFVDFAALDLSVYDWLHFEGRNIHEVERMMLHARTTQPASKISLEAEKNRDGIERLFPLADLLLFSREFAQHHGYPDSEGLLRQVAVEHPGCMATCTLGDKGASAIDSDGTLYTTPAYRPPEVIDTLGAGDTFNAGMIDQLLRGQSLQQALMEATRLAGKKCGYYGLNGLFAQEL